MITALAGEEQWPLDHAYLLSHSAGLPPKTLLRATERALFEPWSGQHDRAWEHWLGAIGDFRDAIAQVLGSERRLVCPQPSVTAGLAQILGALPQRAGRTRLLIAGRAFPSLGFLFAQYARRGYELVLVDDNADTRDPAAWAELLDERVQCVLFTHVHSNTGVCHAIEPLCTLARERGAFSVIDVAQSIGIRPIDAAAWGADFIIGSCIKWLCGGSGAGFLWSSAARLEDCEPVDVGWFSHADPFEFDIRSFRYAEDALRYWGGTPSVAPAVIAGHSIRCLLDVGLERIEAHNQRLLDRLVEGMDASTLVSPRDRTQRGGTAIVHRGNGQERFVAKLRDEGVQFDARADGARLSPHLYNDEGDIERVLRCL
ncbi:MAG: aminotransferase class V-fold PLP-dependent enzyme [Halieaceae bacterium]|jgi:selenocysteine lyase/cysteine desulfurase|nr:aminotransferase class V-fold PLP-dependent enzyme [Halieaceae bacterium]